MSPSMVEKFSGAGLPTWQSKMTLLLMREGVWDIVLEDVSEGSRDAQWRQENERAIALIGLNLADSLVFLKLKFYHLKTNDRDELNDHLAKFG